MKIKSLDIYEFCSFIEKPLHIDFDDNINIIIGENGSGKSTLLKIINHCRSLTLNKIKDYYKDYYKFEKKYKINLSFDIEVKEKIYRIRFSENLEDKTFNQAIFQDSKDPNPDTFHFNKKSYGFEVELIDDSESPEQFYIYKKIDESFCNLYVDDKLVSKKEAPSDFDSVLMYLVGLSDDKLNELQNSPKEKEQFPDFISNHLHPVIGFFVRGLSSANLFPDESNAYFETLSNNLELVCERNQKKDNRFYFSSPFNTSLGDLKDIHTFEGDGNPVSKIELTGKEIPVLNRICEILSLQKIVIEFNLKASRENNIEGFTFWGKPVFKFVKKNNDTFTEEGLSYGQERIIGTLFYLQRRSQAYLLDEIHNGFHHKVVKDILKQIQNDDSQYFITTQSPLVIDSIKLKDASELESRFIICEGKDRFSWVNFPKSKAQEVFEAIQRQIKKTNDVFRSKKIW